MIDDLITKDIVTFERLQRLIIMNEEIIKLMSSRLSTYTDLYLKYFQSQLSHSTPIPKMSHNLFEDAKIFCRDFDVIPKMISMKTCFYIVS